MHLLRARTLHSSVIVTKRTIRRSPRTISLMREMSLLFQLFISFSSRIPRSHGAFLFAYAARTHVLLPRDIKTRSRRRRRHRVKIVVCAHFSSGVPRGALREYILARYWRVAWMLRRPMQRARASRVTVTNENMHSLSYRERVGRVSLCLFFFFFLHPFPFSPFAAYHNRCGHIRGEKSTIPRMSRRRDSVMRCQYNCACCNAFPTSRTSVTLIMMDTLNYDEYGNLDT